MDGVMVGRAAYQNPWMLAGVDEVLYGVEHDVTRLECVHRMTAYLEENYRDDVHAIRAVARHVNGLAQGLPGARRWRQVLSDPAAIKDRGAGLIQYAWEEAFGEG